MSDKKTRVLTYISSVALSGPGIVNFGGAEFASVLPKSGKLSAAVIFVSDPRAERDENTVFMDMTEENHEWLLKVGKVVNEGRNIVVDIEVSKHFTASGKVWTQVENMHTTTDENVEKIVAQNLLAMGERLAKRSESRVAAASRFLTKPMDKSAT